MNTVAPLAFFTPLLLLAVLTTSCNRFTEGRPHPKGKPQGSVGESSSLPTAPGTATGGAMLPSGETVPVVVQTAPLSNYLSIGAFLQKEFDKAENAGRIVKVYAQMRQENDLALNLDALKAALSTGSSNLAGAADEAKKLNFSNIEFDVDIAALKASLPTISNPVSSIEISARTIPAK